MTPIQVTRLHNLKGHSDCIYTLAPALDASQFFSAGGDGMIVLWNLHDPENGQLIARVPNSIYSLCLDVDSNRLIAGQNYAGIHVLDWEQKKEVGSLQLGSAAIFDIKVTNGLIYAGSGDGMLTVIDLASLVVVSRVRISQKSVRTLAIDRVSGMIVAGTSDNTVVILSPDLQIIKQWDAHTNSVFTVSFSPDKKYLITGSRDARLKRWSIAEDFVMNNEVVAHLFAINHLDFSPDGKHFVTCSMDKSIKVWNVEEMRLLKVIDRSRHAGHGTSVNKVLWTSFDNLIVSASDDRTLSVWKIIF